MTNILCSQCHKEFSVSEDQFGALVNCNHCGFVFFLDWNGNPEASIDEPNQSNLQGNDVNDFNSNLINTDWSQSSESEFVRQEESVENIETEAPNSSFLETSLNAESDLPSDFQTEQQFAEDLTSEFREKTEPLVNSVKENFDDIAEFSNSSRSSLLSYNLYIGDINNQKLKLEVLSVLSEVFLQLDFEQIKIEIESRELNLLKLNPPKVAYIVKKLQFSGLKLIWNQII